MILWLRHLIGHRISHCKENVLREDLSVEDWGLFVKVLLKQQLWVLNWDLSKQWECTETHGNVSNLNTYVLQFLNEGFGILCYNCLTKGQNKLARYYASPYMGELIHITVGLGDTSCMWIFGTCEVSFFNQSCATSYFMSEVICLSVLEVASMVDSLQTESLCKVCILMWYSSEAFVHEENHALIIL